MDEMKDPRPSGVERVERAAAKASEFTHAHFLDEPEVEKGNGQKIAVYLLFWLAVLGLCVVAWWMFA